MSGALGPVSLANRSVGPPHDLDAEESLLGAMLLSRDAIAAALECCVAEDFYKPAHGHVFAAVTALYKRGEPADPVTVADELRRSGLLDAVGDASVLISLQVNTPSTANASHYAKIIVEKARVRLLQAASSDVVHRAYEGDTAAHLSDLLDRALDRSGSRRAADLGEKVLRLVPATAIAAQATRWAWRDRIPLGGACLIAGQEGSGKTTLLADVLARASRGQLDGDLRGQPVGAVYATAEDSWARTLRPRLEAAGADLLAASLFPPTGGPKKFAGRLRRPEEKGKKKE